MQGSFSAIHSPGEWTTISGAFWSRDLEFLKSKGAKSMPLLGLITFSVVFVIFSQSILNPKKKKKDLEKDFGNNFREIIEKAIKNAKD